MSRFSVESVKSSKAETVVSRAMSPHTTTDVIIMFVIFLALVISLSVLAWRHPISLSSLFAIPNHDTALPVPNRAPLVHSVASHGHSFVYLLHLRGTSYVIHRWWARASYNHINRIHSTTRSHHEDPVASARRNMRLSRTPIPTLTPTIAFTSSGAASIIETLVDSEVVEVGGFRGPSTSSLAGINDAEPGVLAGVPIVRACSTACPSVEADITDVDKVAMGCQALR